MLDKFLNSIKKGIWFICLSGILIVTGYIFHWFYVLGIGVILAISTCVYIITEIRKGEDGESIGTGCLLTAIFAVAAFFYHDQRYIVPHGQKQHIYSDCSSLARSNSVKDVTELEGFFHLTFVDCKICKERKEKERAARKEARKQEERRELREYLQGLIEELDNGADPKDIEHTLQEDWTVEDDDSYIPGVPSRYQ
ncbi:MAG: hypothetical protein KHX42_04375 [Prevotella sp.]|nr:hypothetical protein [Prevotella sp.]